MTLAAGSTLDLAAYVGGVTPLAATALTLPAEGTVGLTLFGGAFGSGLYAICANAGVGPGDGVARTVTCNGIMSGSAAVSIEGTGRFVVNNDNTASSAVTVTDTATVKVTADGVAPGSRKVLTTCGGFEGAAVTLAADAPDWAKGRLTVNADGNIVLDVQPKGTVIAIR